MGMINKFLEEIKPPTPYYKRQILNNHRAFFHRVICRSNVIGQIFEIFVIFL